MNRAKFIWGEEEDLEMGFVAYYDQRKRTSNIYFILDNILSRKNRNYIKLAQEINDIFLQELICKIGYEEKLYKEELCGWDAKYNYSHCPIEEIVEKMTS